MLQLLLSVCAAILSKSQVRRVELRRNVSSTRWCVHHLPNAVPCSHLCQREDQEHQQHREHFKWLRRKIAVVRQAGVAGESHQEPAENVHDGPARGPRGLLNVGPAPHRVHGVRERHPSVLDGLAILSDLHRRIVNHGGRRRLQKATLPVVSRSHTRRRREQGG